MSAPFDYLDYLLREMVLSDDPDHAHRRAVHALFATRIAEARAQALSEVQAQAVAEARDQPKREALAEFSAFVASAVALATPRLSRPPISVRRGRR